MKTKWALAFLAVLLLVAACEGVPPGKAAITGRVMKYVARDDSVGVLVRASGFWQAHEYWLADGLVPPLLDQLCTFQYTHGTKRVITSYKCEE